MQIVLFFCSPKYFFLLLVTKDVDEAKEEAFILKEPDMASNETLTNSSGLMTESPLDKKNIICPVPLEGPIDWGLVGKGIALSMGQGIGDFFLNYIVSYSNFLH